MMADFSDRMIQRPTTRLTIGQRCRSKQHPELTGRVKAYEWNKPGVLSPIPYCIEWDDSSRAAGLLGWFFVYASDDGVEAIP
jgi:hypothetical protein